MLSGWSIVKGLSQRLCRCTAQRGNPRFYASTLRKRSLALGTGHCVTSKSIRSLQNAAVLRGKRLVLRVVPLHVRRILTITALDGGTSAVSYQIRRSG